MKEHFQATRISRLAGSMGLLFGVVLSLGAPSALAQTQGLAAGSGISGTSHDFIVSSVAAERRVCVACHAPHDTDAQAPEWTPKLALLAFSLYGTAGMVSQPGQPGLNSRLCLSCHDGTLAALNYSGAKRNYLMAGGKLGRTAFNTQFAMRDHPIGVGFDSSLAVNDGSLADPEISPVMMVANKSSHNRTRSGSISLMMLAEGKVECTSCHDVHNRYTAGPSSKGLVKVGLAGSALCIVCHEK